MSTEAFSYKGHEVTIEGPVTTINDFPRWIIRVDGKEIYRSCLGEDYPAGIAKQRIDEQERNDSLCPVRR